MNLLQIHQQVPCPSPPSSSVLSPLVAFPPGKLVDALVLNVSEGTSSSSTQVNLSMRHSVVLGKDSEMELKNLTIGQVVRGTVHRITDFGVFVAIDDTSLVGLSRKAMAVPSETTDLKEVYSVGGHVRAKILGIAGSKISLGLKSSYFKETTTGDDESGDENDDEEEEDDHVAFADDDSDEEEIQKLINEAALHSDSEAEEEGDEDEDEEEDEESDEGESVDDNDEGLPMKKQKVLDGRAAAAVVISSNTSGLSSAKSSRDSGSATPSTSSSSLNPFAQQSNMMLWGSSFEPSVTTKEAQENENEKSESEGDDGSDSENEENDGKRKRNRNSTALKAEEEIRKKEVSHYLNPLLHFLTPPPSECSCGWCR
jgi:predicted RNA-binding protein with RPS1 domain